MEMDWMSYTHWVTLKIAILTSLRIGTVSIVIKNNLILSSLLHYFLFVFLNKSPVLTKVAFIYY